MISRRACAFSVVVLALLLLPVVQASAQQDSSGVTMTASAGFDGFYKEGQWVPVTVNVANEGPSVEGEVRVTVGDMPGDSLVYNSPISLPTRSEKQVTVYVYLPQLVTGISVELLDSRGSLVAETDSGLLTNLTADTLLYVVMSDEPVELGFLDAISGRRPGAAAAFLDLSALPAAAPALNAVDVLIFTNVDSGRLSVDQQTAVEKWVAAGGTLVVTGGLSGPETVAGFVDLLPVDILGSQTVADLPALPALSGEPLRDPGPYLITAATLRNGELLLFEGELPILARRELGNGQVYFLGLDPNAAPLLDWRGHRAIWATIAGSTPDLPIWAAGAQNSYSAANAVTRLPDLRLPSALLLTCFLGFYVFAVGPLNYLVLKRRGRPELAWLTIPLMILLFSMLAYVTSFFFAGRQITLAETSMVYGQVGSEVGRVNTVLGLYSPRRAGYDLVLPHDTLARPFDRNYGSMGGSGNLAAVTRSEDLTLKEVRVDVSGINTFVVDSYTELPDVSGQIELEMGPTGSFVELSLQNNGTMALQDAGLLLGTSYIPLGEIAPGALIQRTEPLSGSPISSTLGLTSAGNSASLSRHYAQILNSTNYYDDPAVYSRWQMLESLNTYLGTASTRVSPGVATLLAWSEEPQLDTALVGKEPERRALTAYFLELPVSPTATTVSMLEIPPELMTWEVLAQSGVYAPDIADFYLSAGWIEYEFAPWPGLQAMDISGLAIVMESGDGFSPGAPPILHLWDWESESWQAVPDVAWGRNSVAGYSRFTGPDNAVRLRLENNGNGVTIAALYPVLLGRFQ